MLTLSLFLYFGMTHAKSSDSSYLAGKWYFGAETGLNLVTSVPRSEPHLFPQGGIIAEYYFHKNWSISTRVKYFNTALYYLDLRPATWFSSGGGKADFSGEVVSIPVNIVWHKTIYKKLSINLSIGASTNFETRSEYKYSSSFNTVHSPTNYLGSNYGIGFNYSINQKSILFIQCESQIGTNKAYISPGFILSWGSGFMKTSNTLFNIGAKFNFSKRNEK